jgi:hypothetical protein
MAFRDYGIITYNLLHIIIGNEKQLFRFDLLVECLLVNGAMSLMALAAALRIVNSSSFVALHKTFANDDGRIFSLSFSAFVVAFYASLSIQ